MTRAALTSRQAVQTGTAMRGAVKRGGRERLGSAAIVYAAAVLHGLVLVSVPASSSVLRAQHGFSDAQYGAAFLPQVALAIIGALTGGSFARRLGLRTVLMLSLLAAAGSQAVLAATTYVPDSLAFALLLGSTGLLGAGFGLAGAPLNAWPARLFPARGNVAVVALHGAIGLGLTAGPLLAGVLMDRWTAFPVLLVGIGLSLAIGTRLLPSGRESPIKTSDPGGHASPARSPAFWLFAAITVLYAFAEGTFSNWAVVYLREGRALPETTAVAGLSAFWGALVAGRLLVTMVLLRVSTTQVWFALPVAMLAAFLWLPAAGSPAGAVAAFAFAGLACSAYFPLTIALASRRFEADVPWVVSALTAALMVGVGAGTFILGRLRNALDFDDLYRASALYPVLVLVLMAVLESGRRLGRSR